MSLPDDHDNQGSGQKYCPLGRSKKNIFETDRAAFFSVIPAEAEIRILEPNGVRGDSIVILDSFVGMGSHCRTSRQWRPELNP